MMMGGLKMQEVLKTMYDPKMVKEDDEEEESKIESGLKSPEASGFEGLSSIYFF